MRKKTGIGLIGAGWSANTIANATSLVSNAEIKGISNHNIDHARQLATKYDIPFVSDDYKELCERDDVDFVIVSLPHFLHEKITIDAINLGKHVLVEKPFATSISSGKKMINVANKAGKILGVYFQQRFSDPTMQAKEILDNGGIGKILQVQVSIFLKRDIEYYQGSPWRGTWEKEGGSALINQAIHDIDRLYYLFKDVTKIHGFFNHLVHDIETEDNAAVAYQLANGAFGTLQVSVSIKNPIFMRTTIFGTGGALIMTPNTFTHYKNDSMVEFLDYTNIVPPYIKRYKIIPHKRLIDAFTTAVRVPDYKFPINGNEGLKSLEFVEQIYKTEK